MLPREIKPSLIDTKYNNKTKKGSISKFVNRNFHHFNALALKNATDGYLKLLQDDGLMFLAMAGAMSTAEIGISLAEMIRRDKIHAISCTGANLEEDVFMLVAHDEYVSLPNYRDLTPHDEQKLYKQHINRVTDTGIPESEAMNPIEDKIFKLWKNSDGPKFPHEYLYELINSGELKIHYQIDPKDSWMVAAAEKNLPLFIPGWEDSTLGNVFAAMCIKKECDVDIIKGGIQYMMELAKWYQLQSKIHPIGFFQIGGGIAGDFPICVVPMLMQDMKLDNVELWSYFCQICDGATSYGNYSTAPPAEKITWGKIGPDTPSFVIESDASIVAPLIFAQILGI